MTKAGDDLSCFKAFQNARRNDFQDAGGRLGGGG
jgi:hypothetical protein